MATATTAELNAVNAALKTQITVLQQRCTRLEQAVAALQTQVSKKG